MEILIHTIHYLLFITHYSFMTSGYLLVDKPAGITSHDVIDALRKITGIRKIGHAGTLDPFATGLLLVGIGKPATKEISTFVGLDKTYTAKFVLGASTDTDDSEGTLVDHHIDTFANENAVLGAIKTFIGESTQIPPAFAAIKINGKKMYELARRGEKVEAKPRNIRINAYTLLSYEPPELRVLIECASGTYIRALARDLGAKLETGGYVKELRRTMIGPFSIKDALPLEKVTEQSWKTHLLSVDKAKEMV